MENDLIRRSDACAELLKCADVYNPDYSDITVTYAVKTVSAIPAVDAVEVVRCRECWAYGTDNERAKAEYLNPDEYCVLMRCEFPPDGYCSYGRRREDGDAT